MGSKLLLFLALIAAGALIFVVVTSLSDEPLETGHGRAVQPDEEEVPLILPPPIPNDPDAETISAESATLSVLVVDEEQHPVPGARISTAVDKVPAATMKAVTDGSGRAVIEGLPGGKKVSVRASGELTAIPGTVAVNLKPGETAETRIVLKAGGAVTGTVLGPGGAPIGIPYRVEIVKTAGGRGQIPAPRRSRIFGGGQPAAGLEFKADERIFSIGGLAPGRYLVRASAIGYISAKSEPFELEKGSIRDGVMVTLDRGGRVTGVVVRGRTGAPVPGANISIAPGSMILLGNSGAQVSMGGSHRTKSDESGRFTLEGIEPGAYTVTASAKDLASAREENVIVEKGRDAEGVFLSLGEGGAITGTIYGPDGQAVPNAQVRISRVNTGMQIFGDFGRRVKANEQGVYHQDHLEPGRYRIKLATGGVSASSSVTIFMSGSVGEQKEKPPEKPLGPDEVLVHEGQITRHDILSPLLCGITGTVADDAGKPVQGMVRLEPLDVEEEPREQTGVRIQIPRFARPDSKGAFEFKGLLPGRYALHASGAREEVSLVRGATAGVEITVRPASIQGTVHEPDGSAAGSVQITVRRIDREPGGPNLFSLRGGGRAKTDRHGAYTLKGLNAGRYRLTATRGELKGESTEIEVGPGEVRKGVRIDLESPTEIRVEVTDRDGKPVVGARVMLKTDSRTTQAARTNSEGIATLRALPGTYTLTLWAPDKDPVKRQIVVGRGGTQVFPLRTD